MITIEQKEKLLKATEINDKIVSSSIYHEEKEKKGLLFLSKYVRDYLKNNPKANSTEIKSLTSQFFTYWNESVNVDTERFWSELAINGIDFERKEPLQFALLKKRFRRVDQGMDARSSWIQLKELKSITDRYTKTELEELDRIIADDEKRRLDILKKCFEKKAIPQRQYLKFGECMAYFKNCHLFDKYFTSEEVGVLYSICRNFKSSW